MTSNINDIYVLPNLKPLITIENISKEVYETLKMKLLECGIEETEIKYQPINKDKALFAKSLNEYYTILKKDNLCVFKNKNDIDYLLSKSINTGVITITTLVDIGEYTNDSCLSFKIGDRDIYDGTPNEFNERVDNIYDTFGSTFCGNIFQQEMKIMLCQRMIFM